jgi:hypothetical protein
VSEATRVERRHPEDLRERHAWQIIDSHASQSSCTIGDVWKRIGKVFFDVIVGAGALACVLVWLEVKPKDVLVMTWPHWLWLAGALVLYAITLTSSLLSLYMVRKQNAKTPTISVPVTVPLPLRPATTPQLAPSPPQSALVASPPQPALAQARVPTNATPGELTDIYRRHTALQAKKLSECYLGTWLKISGSVFDVERGRSGEMTVYLTSVPGVVSIVTCEFQKEWEQRCSVLRKDQKVSVLGKVSRIDATVMSLATCEFI